MGHYFFASRAQRHAQPNQNTDGWKHKCKGMITHKKALFGSPENNYSQMLFKAFVRSSFDVSILPPGQLSVLCLSACITCGASFLFGSLSVFLVLKKALRVSFNLRWRMFLDNIEKRRSIVLSIKILNITASAGVEAKKRRLRPQNRKHVIWIRL